VHTAALIITCLSGLAAFALLLAGWATLLLLDHAQLSAVKEQLATARQRGWWQAELHALKIRRELFSPATCRQLAGPACHAKANLLWVPLSSHCPDLWQICRQLAMNCPNCDYPMGFGTLSPSISVHENCGTHLG